MRIWESFSQNCLAALRVPYNALSSLIYITFSPFSMVIYSWYKSMSISSSMWTISPVKWIWTVSSMSTCMNMPGTSMIATQQFSIVSMTAVRNTASVQTVGDVVSSFEMYSHCLQPSAHPWRLTFPQCFHLRYPRASLHCSSISSFHATGFMTFLS